MQAQMQLLSTFGQYISRNSTIFAENSLTDKEFKMTFLSWKPNQTAGCGDIYKRERHQQNLQRIKHTCKGTQGQMGFFGAMKYFRHKLMGHEIFFKIFDWPQNIFLCSIFVILFLTLRGWSTKYTNQPSRRFKKDKTCLINHIHLANIKQIMLKSKKICLINFDPYARVFYLSN